jgi:hypothetical protein
MATILQFVTFDVLGSYTGDIYTGLLGPDKTEPISNNFEVVGYGSGMFLVNLGSVYLF